MSVDMKTKTVPYNPEIAILWGAAHNVQIVSKHGFEMYLAKYISKPEPSLKILKIELPENCSDPQRFLRTRIVGSVEVLDVLMGFHQNQMSRQVIFLQTELNPCQRMLKPKFELDALSEDSEDIYLQTKLETYLKRPTQLDSLIQSFIDGGILPHKMSKRKQHGQVASVSSNVRVLMISRDTWMPSQPWNQLRHSLLIYCLSVDSRFRVVMIF